MPEGVECLVVAESLQKWCRNQDSDNEGSINFELNRINNEAIVRHSPIPFNKFNEFYSKVDYSKISTFGKTIFIPSTNGYCLAVQLGMTGNFSEESVLHSRVSFLSDFSELHYNDMRKFGQLMLFENKNIPRNIKNLLKNSIDWRNKKAPELFAKRVRRRKSWQNSAIKTILLNQQLIAGIGNIYACECLFSAGINPKSLVKKLSNKKLIKIIEKCQEIMYKSYSVGGMTIYNFTNFGKKGFGRSKLSVYNKRGLGCKICRAAIIQRIKQDNRSTFYCPICQREKSNAQKKKNKKYDS